MEGIVEIEGKRQVLRLVPSGTEGGDDGARLEIESEAKQVVPLSLADVIGAQATERELVVFRYPPVWEVEPEGCCCWLPSITTTSTGDKPPQRRARHLRVLADSAEAASAWEAAIKAALDEEYAKLHGGLEEGPCSRGRTRRKVLIFVNPFSGRRQALAVYLTVVEPLLQQSAVDHQLIVTERQYHAQAFVQTEMDLDEYDGIVAIGGDGVLSEIVNGLYQRDPDALRRIPLAIIAGGTGNGLYASVLHHSAQALSPLSATLLVLKGKIFPADLSLIETQSGERHVSFLSFSWGLVADIDIGSEVVRWAGAFRMDLFGVYCILRKRRYQGRFSFLPPRPEEAGTGSGQGASLPPLNDAVPPEWQVIEGPFYMILVSHVSHIAQYVHIAPRLKLGSGTFQVLVLRRPISRLHLIKLLLALEHGRHIDSEAVEVYSAIAYRVEPLTTVEAVFALDGEALTYGPVQGVVLPKAIRLMGALT